MKHLFAAVLAIAFALLAPAVSARAVEMDAPMTIVLNGADGQPLDEQETAAAIRAGGMAVPQRWVVVNEAPGRIELRAVIRNKHTVVVAAMYSAGEVRFDYHSSIEMNYQERDGRPARIHPNYMAWRTLLENAVRTEAAKH